LCFLFLSSQYRNITESSSDVKTLGSPFSFSQKAGGEIFERMNNYDAHISGGVQIVCLSFPLCSPAMWGDIQHLWAGRDDAVEAADTL
jgi:hypothetical protein